MTTIVLLHGWGATGDIWQAQVQHFKDRVTVLTPTFPVWERDWLHDYLEKLPLKECLVVGWSLGGMLLIEALSGNPGMSIGGVVLVGVAPVFCQRTDYPWGQSAAVVRAMRRRVKNNPREMMKDFALQCLAKEEAGYAFQAQAAFACPQAAEKLAAGLDCLLNCDLRSKLAGLPTGAAIIQGEEDRIVSPYQGYFLQEQLSGAELFNLPGTGHLPFLTQSSAFNGIIEKCLNAMS